MDDKLLCKSKKNKKICRSIPKLIFQLVSFTAIALGCLPQAKGAVNYQGKKTKQHIQRYYAQLTGYSRQTFEVDVTGDGHPEIFVGFVCGKDSCEYLCFKNNVDGTYSYAGLLSLKIGCFKISNTSHNGFKDIIMFRRCSTGSVFRIRYEVRDNEYVIVDNTEVKEEDIPKATTVTMTRLNW